MKKFEIRITYSWGDEESPIEIESEYKEEAFERMIDLAATEAKVSLESHEDSQINISILPWKDKIILHYGYDNEECYYELVEMEE
jgi:hypothetical protein